MVTLQGKFLNLLKYSRDIHLMRRLNIIKLTLLSRLIQTQKALDLPEMPTGTRKRKCNTNWTGPGFCWQGGRVAMRVGGKPKNKNSGGLRSQGEFAKGLCREGVCSRPEPRDWTVPQGQDPGPESTVSGGHGHLAQSGPPAFSAVQANVPHGKILS